MVKMLQRINHVDNGFDFSIMVILALTTSLAVDRQKNSKTSFRTIAVYGNDSKAGQLGFVRVEVEKRRFFSMSMVCPMLQNRWKPAWKRLNGRSYPTRRTLQTLLLPTTICFDPWHTALRDAIILCMQKMKCKIYFSNIS